MTGGALAIAAVLLVLNGFFVAIEFALIAAQQSRLEAAHADGDRRSGRALDAMRRLPLSLSGAQLGITIASLGLGLVAEPAVAGLIERALHPLDLPEGVLHGLGFGIGLFIVVFLHMVVGEMVPKNLALSAPERVARQLSPVHQAFVTVFRPLIWLLNGLASLVLKPFGIEQVDELGTAHTAQELVTMIDASRGEGLIDDARHLLLSGALDFRTRTSASVMIPWDRVVTADRSATVAELSSLSSSSGHTRIPLTAGDAIVGFVHAKDLLYVPEGAVGRPVDRDLIRRMLVVPSSRSLEGVLFAMRRAQVHVAAVRDDTGRVGMLTLEDVLESIVGDILDETDRIRGVARTRT